MNVNLSVRHRAKKGYLIGREGRFYKGQLTAVTGTSSEKHGENILVACTLHCNGDYVGNISYTLSVA